MSVMYHVVVKDWDNFGSIWDDFYCPECLEPYVFQHHWLEVICCVEITPKYLSRLYPPLVNEPTCRICGEIYRHLAD